MDNQSNAHPEWQRPLAGAAAVSKASTQNWYEVPIFEDAEGYMH
jgi:hypothetical protein